MSPSPSGISVEFAPTAREELSHACEHVFVASLTASERRSHPFAHRLLSGALPAEAVAGLCALPIAAPALDGRSGSREAHNDTRTYLDPALIARSPLCAAVARAFQARRTVEAVAKTLGADLDDCHLRIEYAQDAEGFWLAPHTDLGVKRFTLLCYLGPDERPDLGTDLYEAPDRWSSRTAFRPGAAIAFAPSDHTWHGFEPRRLGCVRKSLIVNYVSHDWRAREQLAFPDMAAGRG
jgi:hypothetical protein